MGENSDVEVVMLTNESACWCETSLGGPGSVMNCCKSLLAFQAVHVLLYDGGGGSEGQGSTERHSQEFL